MVTWLNKTNSLKSSGLLFIKCILFILCLNFLHNLRHIIFLNTLKLISKFYKKRIFIYNSNKTLYTNGYKINKTKLGIGKENKTRNYYSIKEKEQRQFTANVKIIIIFSEYLTYHHNMDIRK